MKMILLLIKQLIESYYVLTNNMIHVYKLVASYSYSCVWL